MSRKKIIYIAIFLAVGASTLFLSRGLFKESKKNIIISQPEEHQDIFDDIQPKNESLATVSESEKKPAEPVPPELKKVQPSEKVEPLEIANKLVSWGFEKSSGRTIDTVIIHSSYDAIGSDPFDVAGLIKEYQSYGVAPHYLIDREGKVYRLVEEKNITYHAGTSRTPDGRTNINDFSIGIELMNTKDGKFTQDQYASLKNVLKYIKDRYKIKYVLGHDQIAPGRKDDPWNFDWNKLK